MATTRRKDGKAELRKTILKEMGRDQAWLAARWGRSQPFVSQLLAGKSRSVELERDFAALAQRPHSELFEPSRREVNKRRTATPREQVRHPVWRPLGNTYGNTYGNA